MYEAGLRHLFVKRKGGEETLLWTRNGCDGFAHLAEHVTSKSAGARLQGLLFRAEGEVDCHGGLRVSN